MSGAHPQGGAIRRETWPPFLQTLPAPVIYGLSVALEKSFALITIPLMAAYLTPDAYGKFDVAVTLTELITLIAGLGLAEQLIRFASTAEDDAAAKRCARELLGCAVAVSFGAAVVVLTFSAPLVAALAIPMDVAALRFLMVSACLANLIGLPLTWLRLRDDAVTFLYLVVARTLAQVAGMWLALASGFGAEGVLVANGAILTTFALLLTLMQWRKTGLVFSAARFTQVARYGAPIVGAMLAMFALGNANRLFLAQHAEPEMIGYLGLAARFAMATGLLLYPLELWWLPKRIAALREPGGLQRSAVVWGIGVAILILSGAGVALAAPVFIAAVLPPAYLGALAFLPLLVIAHALHDTAGLTEVGSYARENGYRVLAIDAFGAAIAIAGFAIFIPHHGVYGAIGSVYAAQLCRIACYVWDGAELAPIPYPWGRALLAAMLAALLVYLAPAPVEHFARLGWTILATLALVTLFLATGLIPLPSGMRERLRGLLAGRLD